MNIINDSTSKYELFKRREANKAAVEQRQFIIGRLAVLLENGSRAIGKADWCLHVLDIQGAETPKNKAESLQNIKKRVRIILDFKKSSSAPQNLLDLTVSDIDQFCKKLEVEVESSIRLESELQERVKMECDIWLQKCRAALQILMIPGMARTANASEKTLALISSLEELTSTIRTMAREESTPSPIQSLEKEWRKASEVFDKHVISYENLKRSYSLSDSAIEIIKQLLNNEKVSLSSVDKKDLEDLHKLKGFSGLLTIQFTHNESEEQ